MSERKDNKAEVERVKRALEKTRSPFLRRDYEKYLRRLKKIQGGCRMRNSKYGNRKTMVHGIAFDSRREARRYVELSLLQRAGEIRDLKLQEKFELIPAVKDETGKVVERAAYYIADFVYTDKNGQQVVEDAKGARTREYILKRKLMRWRHGISIVEV